jgi:predicted HicB family RNase H-like nuclease
MRALPRYYDPHELWPVFVAIYSACAERGEGATVTEILRTTSTILRKTEPTLRRRISVLEDIGLVTLRQSTSGDARQRVMEPTALGRELASDAAQHLLSRSVAAAALDHDMIRNLRRFADWHEEELRHFVDLSNERDNPSSTRGSPREQDDADAATTFTALRVSPSLLDAIDAAALKAKLDRSEWIRGALNRALGSETFVAKLGSGRYAGRTGAKKAVGIRVPTSTLRACDAAANRSGVSRNAWIVSALEWASA